MAPQLARCIPKRSEVLAMSPLVFRATETMVVILGGLAAGYTARRRGLPDRYSPAIQEFTLIYVEPVVIVLSLWSLNAQGLRMFLLPLLAGLLIVLMWPVGDFAGRLLGLRAGDLGAYVVCSMFSNVGITYGTFLCYALLGERGVALGYLYVTSFSPILYTLGFYVVRLYGYGERPSAWRTMAQTLAQPESRNPIMATIAGLALFASGLPWPELAKPAVDVLVPTSTFAKLFAIGLSLRPRVMLNYWKPAAVMHVLKFVVSPALGLVLAWAGGLTGAQDRALMQVVLIEAASPVAIMSIVLAQVTGLNVQLANTCWLATNLSAIALAPLWLYIASLL
ncbi:MAG: AEC family transporter [Armatimonadetes bacterium]|nr:AEC family transporter [Armatimonadota bacterium]